MNRKMKELLDRYFDGLLNEDEKKQLSKALQESPGLRAEKRRIADMREMIADSADAAFSPFFAERVMNRIESLGSNVSDLDTFGSIAGNIFQRFVLAGVAAAAVLFVVNVLSAESISFVSLFFSPEVTVNDMIDPLLAYSPGTF